jgi:hypothetical protein
MRCDTAGGLYPWLTRCSSPHAMSDRRQFTTDAALDADLAREVLKRRREMEQRQQEEAQRRKLSARRNGERLGGKEKGKPCR